jgi:hypothetical protein
MWVTAKIFSKSEDKVEGKHDNASEELHVASAPELSPQRNHHASTIAV